MRSLRLTEFGQPLAWDEGEPPTPGGAEVLLQTLACGVCHSDVHLWEGYYPLAGEGRLYVSDRGVRLPLTLGHEIVGRVVAAGPEAAGVQPGDVRLVYPWIGCDACRECAAGRHHLCSAPRSLGVFSHGGYSDHVLVPDARFLVEIGDLAPEAACSYACAGLTAYGALRKILPLDPSDALVIVGAGGLGLMALRLAGELTGARLFVVDVSDRQLDAARALADCVTIAVSGTADLDRVRERVGPDGAAAVVDFVGTTATTELGFSLLRKSGILVLVGLFGGGLSLPIPPIPLRNLTIRGSYTGSLAELKELVEIAGTRALPALPTSIFPLARAQSALERLRAGEITGRAVLTF